MDSETNGTVIYQPPDAFEAPRFTGPRTFARLPHLETLDRVDCAVFGMPWDGGTSFRSGARFGPEAVRSGSTLLRPVNPLQDVQVFGSISTIDYGDAPTTPGYIEKTLEQIERFVAPIPAAGIVPLGIGGDHSVTLAEIRAIAAKHGPLGLIQIDAHADLYASYNGEPYNHGTFVRRAIEEGLVDPARTLQAGLRGPMYGDEERGFAEELGLTQVVCDDLVAMTPGEFSELARSVTNGGPTFMTFDIDALDPSVCPGTGTPEVAGLTGREAMRFLRSLTGINFVGFDVVEVAPQYDGPGQTTAFFAANVLFEMLSLVALAVR